MFSAITFILGTLPLVHAPLTPSPLLAQSDTVWQWNSTIKPGRWLRLYDLAGDVKLTSSPDNQVHIVATLPRKLKLTHVHFMAVRTSDGVTICALPYTQKYCDGDSSSSRPSSITRITDDGKIVILGDLPATDISIQNGQILFNGKLVTSDMISDQSALASTTIVVQIPPGVNLKFDNTSSAGGDVEIGSCIRAGERSSRNSFLCRQ